MDGAKICSAATFADPALEAAFWERHTRAVLVDTDRRYYAGSAAVLAVAIGVLIRDGAYGWEDLGACLCALALAIGAALSIDAAPAWYLKRREGMACICRLAFAVAAAWLGGRNFQPRLATPFAVFGTKLMARGPVAALVSGGIGLQLRPAGEAAIQTVCLAASIFVSTGMIDSCSTSPEQAGIFREAERAIDGVGVVLMAAMDHGDMGAIERLTAPVDDPCSLVAAFAMIWLGWAAPLAASWAMARRARRAFLAARVPGGGSMGPGGKPCACGALATAIWTFNGMLSMELSWRVLKWGSAWVTARRLAGP